MRTVKTFIKKEPYNLKIIIGTKCKYISFKFENLEMALNHSMIKSLATMCIQCCYTCYGLLFCDIEDGRIINRARYKDFEIKDPDEVLWYHRCAHCVIYVYDKKKLNKKEKSMYIFDRFFKKINSKVK